MNPVVDLCRVMKLEDDLESLCNASDDAVQWLDNMTTTAFAK